ncbi:MAG TPA: MFS transporter [Streptosporangiaceae bacterium]|nr:MFS transporter [Streptosporangiaceae bacterium]
MAGSVEVPAGEAAIARHGGRSLALAVLCVVVFLTFLDNTVVSVALGNVQTELHAGVAGLQWVVGAYALTFAGAMLGFGMVGDEFGRKRVMVIGIVVFCGGSILSAEASSIGVLIAGRAIMGFGAAASEPGTLSMIRHIYTDERSRAWALAVWTSVTGVALAMGPVIGGALLGEWDWRAIFWFNLIVGAIALLGVLVVLPENADPDGHRVDTTGVVFGALALSALAFAVILAESSGYGSARVIPLLCVSFLAVIAFFWWERRAVHPLLDLRFIRVPRFAVANVVAFCSYFATFAVFFFTALYLEEVAGYSGYRIALLFVPMMVLLAAAALLAGRSTVVIGARWTISIGCLLFALGLLLTSFAISPHPAYLSLAGALALTGIGVGATVVPATSSALSAVPPERSGMAASTTNTSREIGAVTGVAVLGALVSARLSADIASRLQVLGLPKSIQQYVINGVETGYVPSTGHTQGAGGAAGAGQLKLVQEVIQAAYGAFESGLHAALYLGAALVLIAGVFSFFWLRRAEAGDAEGATTQVASAV